MHTQHFPGIFRQFFEIICRTWYQKGVGSAVELALRTGYRLVDCAFVYLNEAEVGETLQTCFKNGVVRREDIFITSKLWYVLQHPGY